MKIFISHQQADSVLALQIAGRLRAVHRIDCYLDVIDPAIGRGDDLATHVRDQLARCTQLIAVVSEATRTSWWVPWEIGIATEKDYPLATYAGGYSPVPEYLRKWPYLRSDGDLDRYVAASRNAAADLQVKRGYFSEVMARERSTKEFFRSLRASLGQ